MTKQKIVNKQIQNFWSLNANEVYVASWLKDELGPNYEVFFPANSRFPYVDLIVFNSKNKETTTVQVKSSQSYSGKYEDGEYWGSGHDIQLDKINPEKVDFFIFPCYYPMTIKKKTGNSMDITKYFVVFQTSELKKYVRKFKKQKLNKSGRIPFSFCIYPDDTAIYDEGGIKEQHVESDEMMLVLRNARDNSKIIKKRLQ